ncbi:MAG: Ig-like domain-containing protein, partial [Clostridia bacterium]|nr:Ig-like domain-containing protein [Clostridia bacterium]
DTASENGVAPEGAQNIEPGQHITKAPNVQNVGKNPAYVYLKVYVPVYDEQNLFSYTVNETSGQTGGWTLREGEQKHTTIDGQLYNIYVYEYDETLQPNTTTDQALFDEVVFANGIYFTPEQVATMGTVKKVIVKAYAIQSESGVEKSSNDITELILDDNNESAGLVGSIQVGNKLINNHGTVTLLKGASSVQISFANSQGATYTSSDTSVATVSNAGAISAVNAGTTTISIGGSGIKAKEFDLEVVENVQNATIKVGTETVVPGTSIKLEAGDEAQITTEDGEEMTYSISPTNAGISVDSTGKITVSGTAEAGATATITLTGKLSGNSRTITIEVPEALTGDDIVPSTNYGQKVNYSVSVKDGVQVAEGTTGAVELDDWEIFLKDGDYVYMIYGDYLPNSAISSTAKTAKNLSTGGTYRVWSTTNRTDLISAMTTTSYWSHLITSDLQTAATTAGSAAVATGGATAGQFKQSWNDQYPGQVTISGNDSSGWTTQSLSSYAGYSSVAEADNLYFPHKSALDDPDSSNRCWGYWLASPYSGFSRGVMCVSYDGYVNTASYYSTAMALRPLVRLPSSILEQNADGVTWDIKY